MYHLIKLHTDGPADVDILVGVGQHARLHVAAEHLYLVAVATTAEQAASISQM